MFPNFRAKEFHFDNEAPNNVPLFLTPLIHAGKISEARRAARVTDLPGPTVESYAGYFTVNAVDCGSNLFFWYFPAKFPSNSTSTLLWLQGGPGGTSLFGLFNEHGPFSVTAQMKLKARANAWTLTHNVIYIDNPVGTGYSFTAKDSCYAKNQKDVAEDLYQALQQFFTVFPRLRRGSDFFVTGESYAGKYVPAISYKIHKEMEALKKKDPANYRKNKHFINFRGMAIGDGLCDPVTMTNYGDFLFNIGLIDEQDRGYFKNISHSIVQAITAKKFKQAFQLFDNLLNGDLTGHPSYFAESTGYQYYFNYLTTKEPIDMNYYDTFVQLPDVRRSMHVGNMTWNDGKKVEEHLLLDVMDTVKPWIVELLNFKNYKIMIYNGMMDVIIAWPLTESFITSMHDWTGLKGYVNMERIKWRLAGDSGRLAGYAKQVGNFTQVLIRNAGHMVPYDQPKPAFDMINRFTAGKKFSD